MALLVGLVLTLGAVVLHWTRVWEPLERQTIDWRFAVVPRPDRTMSDEIRFVDIDDGAMDSIGAWPWKRSIFAKAIDELRRAGASVVALDILFEEPQEPSVVDGAMVDHDRALAEAFSRMPVVLAVRIGEDATFSEWTAGTGTPTAALLDAVAHDIQLDPVKEAERFDIPTDLRARIEARPQQFWQIAVWRRLNMLLGRDQIPPTFEAMKELVDPGRDKHTGVRAQEPRLRALYDQFKAWMALRKFALPGRTVKSSHVVAPLRIHAEQAAMAGVVNPELDDDGHQRSIRPVWPTPIGTCLQFGLAAASKFRNLELNQVDLLGDSIRMGSRAWPLDNGKVWIDWPTSGWGWANEERNNGPIRRMSIGLLVELSQLRDKVDAKQRNVDRLAIEVADLMEMEYKRDDDGIPIVDESLLAQVREEAEFQADSFSSIETPTKEEEDLSAPYRNYLREEETLKAAKAEIAEADTKLQSFRGKLVFIGWTATGALADFVGTPLDPRTPGVMVHAVMADMMLTGNLVSRMTPLVEAGLLVAMGLVGSMIAARLGSIWSFLGLSAAGAAYLAGGCWLFSSSAMLVPLVGPMGAALVSWLGATTYIAGVNQRERQRITRQFKSRVSSQLVDHLVHNPNSVSVAGDQREMTIIFADLAGFTSIAERLGGAATVSTLNRFMGALTNVLVEQNAYLNKFLGDGLMAFWSAFAVDADQAASACRAAEKCQEMVDRLNAELAESVGTALSLRTGVATGVVVVGDCGAPPALNDYTVIGDAVNLAARLESANKQFGSRVLIDGRTHELAGDAARDFVPLGRVVVVGQSKPVALFARFKEPVSDHVGRKITDALAAYGGDHGASSAALWVDIKHEAPALTQLCDLYLSALETPEETTDGVLRLSMK